MAHQDEKREALVKEHLPLVRSIASRLTGRGEALEDLIQIGVIGLLKAIDRFDPARQVTFRTYATPFILGEMRHHLRDRAEIIRVPRSLQDKARAINVAESALTATLGRSPTLGEVAERTKSSREEVIEARELGWTRRVLSLDQPLDSSDANSNELGARIASPDALLEGAIDRTLLEQVINQLSGAERIVIGLRFIAEMTQMQVAERLGCSQMQVSRLQSRALGKLRIALGAERED